MVVGAANIAEELAVALDEKSQYQEQLDIVNKETVSLEAQIESSTVKEHEI